MSAPTLHPEPRDTGTLPALASPRDGLEVGLSKPIEIEIKQMLPEEKSPPTLTEDEKKSAEREGRLSRDKSSFTRLDVVATTLTTASTITLALLAAVGFTGDRIAVLLNSTSAGRLVLGAVVAAGVAVLCGAIAVGITHLRAEWWLVVAGIIAFLVSIALVASAASTAFDDDGRPTISGVATTDESGGAAVSLSFTVSSAGVAKESYMRAVAIWVRNSEQEVNQAPFYSTVLRPDAGGMISQSVTILLPRPATDKYIRIQVIRSDVPTTQAITDVTPNSKCNDQRSQNTAPACVDVLIPKAPAA